uniref:CDGSH iron-sulfur domain-containing protein 3, mitochondrial-like n=1 Tax=Centroberyx gerrardi TaxID=166262 RepID=UPI003AAA6115
MNAGLIVAVRKGCVETMRQRQPRPLPGSSWMVQRCLLSAQPAVAARLPYRVKVSAGKRYAWCTCGHSKKQPFCDGAHKTKAPSIAPLRFTPDRDRTVTLCACKQTGNAPYCDGTHFKVIFRDLVTSVKKMFK